MKRALLLTVMLFSSLAHAQMADTDMLRYVPTGSKIRFTKSVTILANSTRLELGETPSAFSTVKCYLEYDSKPVGRVISAGRTMDVTSVFSKETGYTQTVVLKSTSASLTCERGMGNPYLGEAKKALAASGVVIEIAPPQEF